MGKAGIVRVTTAVVSLSGRVRSADVTQHEGSSVVPLSGPGRHGDRIKNFYQRLLDKGREKKVTLIAAARKLLVILNTMLKNQTTWDPNHSPTAA
jgi:hypothetical protein